MRKQNMSEYCVQAVHNLRTVSLDLVGLRTVLTIPQNSTVDLYGTYTSSKSIFVLGLVHCFFAHLTEVTDRLMPTIHTTNKDKYKYKLRIST